MQGEVQREPSPLMADSQPWRERSVSTPVEQVVAAESEPLPVDVE